MFQQRLVARLTRTTNKFFAKRPISRATVPAVVAVASPVALSTSSSIVSASVASTTTAIPIITTTTTTTTTFAAAPAQGYNQNWRSYNTTSTALDSGPDLEYTDNVGRLFGEPKLKPGVKRKWAEWEATWYFGMFGAMLILVLGALLKPDYTITTWAREEAVTRLLAQKERREQNKQ